MDIAKLIEEFIVQLVYLLQHDSLHRRVTISLEFVLALFSLMIQFFSDTDNVLASPVQKYYTNHQIESQPLLEKFTEPEEIPVSFNISLISG